MGAEVAIYLEGLNDFASSLMMMDKDRGNFHSCWVTLDNVIPNHWGRFSDPTSYTRTINLCKRDLDE